MGEPNFETEGLLDGLEGDARTARQVLLAELTERGVELDELRRAVDERRLVLLPAERVLAGEGERLTAVEVSERAGLELDLVKREWRALGLALSGDEEPVYNELDVEGARRVKQLLDAGVPEEGVLEVARLLGMTMSQLAAANRRLIAETFTREGDTELDVAHRFAAAAEAFMPLIADTLAYVLRLHLREQIRHEAFELAEISSGQLETGDAVTVCFADMVDFTRLGETLDPEALGAVTGRLGELAAEAVTPPVRLVKLIGDAAMLVGPDPGPVVDAALELVQGAEAEGDEFPLLRAGVASGRALSRSGDWYGRPVNIASRITGIARPGSVLVAEDVREALDGAYAWSFAGERRLKGIEARVKLYRCRPGDGSQTA